MKRPTAEDRDLADVLRKMKPGDYYISVTRNEPFMITFMEKARLKTEGSVSIRLDKTTIDILPVKL